MSTVSFDESSKTIMETIIQKLIPMLDEINVLVKHFRTIRDMHI